LHCHHYFGLACIHTITNLFKYVLQSTRFKPTIHVNPSTAEWPTTSASAISMCQHSEWMVRTYQKIGLTPHQWMSCNWAKTYNSSEN
jgi:hypothetical protein